VNLDRDRLGSALIRPPAARLRRYVETERADRALRRNNRHGDRATLDAAITAFERAAAASNPGDGDHARCLGNLSAYRRKRFALTEDPADLDAAIQCARQALEASPLFGQHRPWLFEQLAMALHAKYGSGGDLADLTDAVAFARASARATSHRKHDDLGKRWALYESYAYDSYMATGQRPDLDAAVEGARNAAAVTRPNHARRARRLADLAHDLVVRYEDSRRPHDLRAAIDAVTQATAVAQQDPADRAFCFRTLSIVRLTQFDQSDDHAVLHQAMEAARHAVAAWPEGDARRATYASALAVLLLRLHDAGEGPAWLAEALAGINEALSLTDPADSDYPGMLSNRAVILLRTYERTSEREMLDAAVADTDAADAGLPATHPERVTLDLNSSTVRLRYYEVTGGESSLARAMAAARAALEAIGLRHHLRSSCLSNLGLCLGRRYELRGDPADLDDAIDALREAEATTSVLAHRAVWLANLCAFLRLRFERTGDETDLDLSVDVGRHALESAPPGSVYRALFLSGLGASMLARYLHSGGRADLDGAIDAHRAAADAAGPDDAERPMYLANLAIALDRRFRSERQLADAEDAVRCCREAISIVAPGHANLARYRSFLAFCLDGLAYETEDATALSAAIEAATEALEESRRPDGSDHPDRARQLYILGDAQLTRYLLDDDRQALEAVFDAWRAAMAVRTASPRMRLSIAQDLGRRAVLTGDLEEALNAFTAAIAMLPSVVWHGLPAVVRQEQASRWAGLAAEAACCALLSGRPELAVELLEQGRSMFWRQALDLHADLEDLASVAPDLAAKLQTARIVMNGPPQPSADGSLSASPYGPQLARQESNDRLARAARDYDETLQRVRAMPGFARYLDTTPYRELAAAGAGGAVVIVNASRFGCHAVIVAADRNRPTVLELPGLDLDGAVHRAAQMAAILGRFRNPQRHFLDRERDRHTLLDILDWLWDVVAQPVLAALGNASTADSPEPGSGDSGLPRIWWCPIGPLVSLPLHAAGHHPRHRPAADTGTQQTVLARTVSSYIPTLAALRRAKSFAPPARLRHLTVATPVLSRPDFPPLPDVATELDRLSRYFPPGPVNHQFVGELATRDRVLAELGSHDWIHLACHAGPLHADQPGSAQLAHGFALWDSDLTIADLAARQPDRLGGLAFLSACQTASAGPEHRDEALHLGAAMQFLGYSDVVATMWSIADSPAPRVADLFYEDLAARGGDHAAHALRQSVLRLRDEDPTDPFRWAPYVHIGR
jgi:hypothetical protein